MPHQKAAKEEGESMTRDGHYQRQEKRHEDDYHNHHHHHQQHQQQQPYSMDHTYLYAYNHNPVTPILSTDKNENDDDLAREEAEFFDRPANDRQDGQHQQQQQAVDEDENEHHDVWQYDSSEALQQLQQQSRSLRSLEKAAAAALEQYDDDDDHQPQHPHRDGGVAPSKGEDDDDDHHHQQHHGHHNPHSSSTPDLLPFFSPPQQRQRWGDRQLHPHTNFGDLFFDLFYVATAYNLGSLLREDPSVRGLLYLVACFLPIMGLWAVKMFYDSRYFYGDDLWHRFYEVATVLALAGAVLHIKPVPVLSDPAQHVDMFAYGVCICLGYVLSAGRLLEIAICQRLGTAGLYPESQWASRRDLFWHVGPTLFYLAATAYAGVQYYQQQRQDQGYDVLLVTGTEIGNKTLWADSNHSLVSDSVHRLLASSDTLATDSSASSPAPTPALSLTHDDVAAWLLVGGAGAYNAYIFVLMVMYACLPKNQDFKSITVPMNIDYAIHRYGEWIMLMLGESVLSLLIVTLSRGSDYYKTFFCGVISIAALEYLHFRSQPHNADEHAMRRSRYSGFLYNVLMQIYSIALIILGTCYKMFLYEYVYEESAGYGSGRRAVLQVWSRLLAGSSSSALRFDTHDRQQRIANFFCGSMAVVWICLDGMSLAHTGLAVHWKRSHCDCSRRAQAMAASYVFLRVALIGFIATLSTYATSPNLLAFLGLCSIVCQLGLRMAGQYIFHRDEDKEEEEAIERMVHYATARVHQSNSNVHV